jgi:hypothetical protein
MPISVNTRPRNGRTVPPTKITRWFPRAERARGARRLMNRIPCARESSAQVPCGDFICGSDEISLSLSLSLSSSLLVLVTYAGTYADSK